MKKISVLAALFSLLPAFAVLAGDAVRIGYSCSNFNDTFQTYVLDAARAEAERAGVTLVVEDALEDADAQIAQVEKMISNGLEALVVVPVDTGKVDALVSLAARAEIPLVFVNRNPYPGQRPPDNCFVICTDAFVEGETQMHYAGKVIGSMGHVVILQGMLNNEATQSRTQGVKEVIAATYPELAIVAEASGNWQRDQAKVIVREWLKAFGREKMDAIISNNDEMALGALSALDEAGVTGVVVLGIDATPEALEAIQDGRMAGTVLQDPVAQGKGAVEIAVRAVNGEKQAQNFILPSELVTRDNLDTYLQK